MRDWGEGLLGRAVIKCCNPKHLLWLSSLDVMVYQNGRLKVTLCDNYVKSSVATTASKLNDSPDRSVGINRYFKTFPTIYIAGL